MVRTSSHSGYPRSVPEAEVARRPKNRRAQIALVAAELFCERGFHGVGIDEIAAAVGISGPAVYRHFPNKYAILVAATRELTEATLEATAGPTTLDELLPALARLTVERRRAGSLYQWEGRHLTDEHRAEFRAARTTLLNRVRGPLRRLRPELDAASAGLLATGALSVLGSLTTHRAVIAAGRAESVLCRAARAVLDAPAPAPVPAETRKDQGQNPDQGVRVNSRRERLLSEAIRLFRANGYHAVGIHDIGRAAGINASSVYRYFPGKGDLLAAAYYRASERLAATVSGALAAASGPADAIDRLVESYVAFAFGESDLICVYLAENNSLPEQDRHELRKTQRLHVEEWVRLLVEVRADVPAPEARLLVHAALNLVTDLGRAVRFDRSTGADRHLVRLAHAVLEC
jgi:AcrR family transcriptional regulator